MKILHDSRISLKISTEPLLIKIVFRWKCECSISTERLNFLIYFVTLEERFMQLQKMALYGQFSLVNNDRFIKKHTVMYNAKSSK